jgi:hypothetical protein
MPKKISLSAKRKAAFRRLIQRLKKDLKSQEPYLEKCKEYSKDPNFVDEVKICFQPLDVSAKTVNGIIILNEKLIESGDWEDIMRYVVHEMVHVMQQEAGKVKGKVDKDEYLDDENEQEAFQAQIEYMDDHESPEKIQQYLEDLLDHHDIQGPKREQYIRELTKDI